MLFVTIEALTAGGFWVPGFVISAIRLFWNGVLPPPTTGLRSPAKTRMHSVPSPPKRGCFDDASISSRSVRPHRCSLLRPLIKILFFLVPSGSIIIKKKNS